MVVCNKQDRLRKTGRNMIYSCIGTAKSSARKLYWFLTSGSALAASNIPTTSW